MTLLFIYVDTQCIHRFKGKLMSITTASLLPEVIQEQINWAIDALVELEVKFSQGEISLREYNIQSEELWATKELLESQLANW